MVVHIYVHVLLVFMRHLNPCHAPQMADEPTFEEACFIGFCRNQFCSAHQVKGPYISCHKPADSLQYWSAQLQLSKSMILVLTNRESVHPGGEIIWWMREVGLRGHAIWVQWNNNQMNHLLGMVATLNRLDLASTVPGKAYFFFFLLGPRLTFLRRSSSQPVDEWRPVPGVYHASWKMKMLHKWIQSNNKSTNGAVAHTKILSLVIQQKEILGPKTFWGPKHFGVQNILGPNFIKWPIWPTEWHWTQNSWTHRRKHRRTIVTNHQHYTVQNVQYVSILHDFPKFLNTLKKALLEHYCDNCTIQSVGEETFKQIWPWFHKMTHMAHTGPWTQNSWTPWRKHY